MRLPTYLVVALAAVFTGGCSGDDGGANGGTTGEAGTDESTAGTFGVPNTESGEVGDESTGPSEEEAGDGEMGECSVWEQDCPAGDKCAPWSDAPDLTPDDIRCCPEVPNGKIHGEACAVEGYFGSCIDDCAVGHMCLDIDNDGSGVCQKFCTGSADDPICELDETCLIYFAGVPFCFPQCDPLVQDCLDGQGCYPDEATAGDTGFICLPVIGGGKLLDPCWLLSSCEPGLLCVSPEFVPGCPTFAGCCSALCDTSAADECPEIVPGTECVNWYYAGGMPPSVDLEDVGACVIPP